MATLLIKFWPVWVPLILYILWLMMAAGRARKHGTEKPKFAKGRSWTITWIATLAVLAAMFLWIAGADTKESGQYVPARSVNGEIVPGHFTQDNP